MCSVWRPTSFKETVTATCNKQYFVDVYENRGDSKSRVANRGCLVDGHVAKHAIFHMFSKLFQREIWELKAAVLRNVDFVLVFVISGLPGSQKC